MEKPSTMNMHTVYHHIGASFGYSMSLFAGYGMPGIASASLLCEFSSVFLNYKDMFKKHRDTPCGMINQLLFIFFFVVIRILFFPVLMVRCFVIWHVYGKYVGWFRYIAMGLTSF